MSSWDNEDACKVCGDELIALPYGQKASPILLIGEYPGEEEIKEGIPFIGKTGAVLRTELAFKGIDLNRLRRCNMWIHAPNDRDDCFKYGIELAIKEAIGKQLVLLIGSETVKYFCNELVSNVNGLLVTSSYLSAPKIMACVQPATVFHGSVGEFRLAMEKFTREVKKLSGNVEVNEDEW